MTLVFAERHRGQGRGYWHAMGTEAEHADETASAIAERAGLNYQIAKRPIQTRDMRGHIMQVPDQYAVLSDMPGNEQVIAIVGREFEPVQNMTLATMLDRSGLVGPGGRYSMDAAGASQDGRLVYWALKARNSYQINGDDYQDHWILVDGKDGNRALTMALTPMRFICSNAIQMAVSGATIRIGIAHTRNAETELDWWISIATKLDDVARTSRDLLKRLGKIQVTGSQMEALLDATYPKPAARGRAQLYAVMPELKLDDTAAASVERANGQHSTELLRVLERRENVISLFESYASDPEEKRIAGTLLGYVNAVADIENHRAAKTVREDVALSNFYGPRYQAQANAMRAAMVLAR